jgi:hypothetical protein
MPALVRAVRAALGMEIQSKQQKTEEERDLLNRAHTVLMCLRMREGWLLV